MSDPFPKDATMAVENKIVRVAIVEANPIMREGLRLTLSRAADVTIEAEASDGHAAVMACRARPVDVAVIDYESAGVDVTEALANIKRTHPALQIVLTYVSCQSFEIANFLALGVSGFVLKNAQPDEFLLAVRTVASGGCYFSSAISRSLFRPASASHAALNFCGLSTREMDVLRLVASGLSNKEVARDLNLSVRTVETHRLNLRKKSGAGRLKDLVHLSARLGLTAQGARTAAEASL